MKRGMNVGVCVIAALAIVAAVASLSPAVRAQTTHRAGLVVHFGDATLTRCVEFSEPQISGYDVLLRSGLAVVADVSPIGVAVCALEGTGCPVESCLLCAAPNYWSYWRLNGDSWAYSQLGAAATTVQDGDVEGWSWGNGNQPPLLPFDQICTPPPAPTDTPRPTATPAPPTATPPPPEAWFRLDANPIAAGACTTLRWDTMNAQAAYLDDSPVALSDSRQVCPSAPQSYRLRVVGIADERTYELTLDVIGTPPTPTVTSPAAPPTAPALAATPSATAWPTPVRAAASSTRTPTASPTPTTIGEAGAPATPLPLPSPTAPLDTPTAPVAPVGESAPPSRLPGYLAFGVIVCGMVGWLILSIRRRS